MPSQPLYFYDGAYIKDSPAVTKQNITWLGNLKSAQFILNFGGKFGWELKYAELNGHRYNPTKTNEIRTGDIKADLVNGENALTVVYDYIGFGNQTTITAYVVIDSDLGTLSLPSLGQWAQDFQTWVKDQTPVAIVVMVVAAIIAIAIAVIVSKFAGGGLPI